ncbi:hypothetical protein [Patulibacter sp. SYSU D01012]|uniref:hypothetical protein n=1 Tax=Patulibacter sp. SYSU D01012 TaxID=2817381 RepID=UPI001B304F86|nr:hypothetical protein [Patulibacter sp. SYSU D01012]
MPAARPLLPVLVAAAALATAGCGGDVPSTTSAAAAPPATAGTTPTVAQDDPVARLGRYAAGGRPATGARAGAVVAAARTYAIALRDHDDEAACAVAVGVDALLRAGGGPAGDCAGLLRHLANASQGPTTADVAALRRARVVIAGDQATLTVDAHAPLPLRRVDGRWRIDYGAFAPPTPEGRRP